jgi:hypothetical protein
VNLLNVLADLQEKTAAEGFALAGGTSLALRLGHRLSVDLDFFTASAFTPQSLTDLLGYGPEAVTGQADGTLQLRINGVKVEFIRHPYPKLADDDRIQGVTMWSIQDIAAMKLNAISNRGSKKDFYDLAALLGQFPLPSLIGYYQKKYRPASLMMLIRSLAWFDDADAEPDPISLCNETWPAVMHKISTAIRALA